MKLAISSFISPGRSWAEKFDSLAKLNFAGMEIRLAGNPEDHAEQARQIARIAANSAIKPCSLVRPTPAFLVGLTHETWTAKLEDITSTAAIAAILGVPALMCVEFEAQPALSPFEALKPADPERQELILRFLMEADRIAAREGIVFLLEPLNRYESSIYHRIGDAAQFCRAIGSRSLGILADTFHLNIEESDIGAALLETKDLLAHVQLGDNNRLLPGQGRFDFESLFRSLVQAGYQGYMALECIASQDDWAALSDCVSFLQNMLDRALQ
jgi:sugar phosphate isomerase/epimerase